MISFDMVEVMIKNSKVIFLAVLSYLFLSSTAFCNQKNVETSLKKINGSRVEGEFSVSVFYNGENATRAPFNVNQWRVLCIITDNSSHCGLALTYLRQCQDNEKLDTLVKVEFNEKDAILITNFSPKNGQLDFNIKNFTEDKDLSCTSIISPSDAEISFMASNYTITDLKCDILPLKMEYKISQKDAIFTTKCGLKFSGKETLQKNTPVLPIRKGKK